MIVFLVYLNIQLTNREAVNELFSNITWAHTKHRSYEDPEVLAHWMGPHTNLYVTLAVFVIMRVCILVPY